MMLDIQEEAKAIVFELGMRIFEMSKQEQKSLWRTTRFNDNFWNNPAYWSELKMIGVALECNILPNMGYWVRQCLYWEHNCAIGWSQIPGIKPKGGQTIPALGFSHFTVGQHDRFSCRCMQQVEPEKDVKPTHVSFLQLLPIFQVRNYCFWGYVCRLLKIGKKHVIFHFRKKQGFWT